MSLRDQVIRLASDDKVLRPHLARILVGGRWNSRKVLREVEDNLDAWLTKPTRPDNKDIKRLADIIRKAGGDPAKVVALGYRMAKSIKGIEKAIRRGAAAEARREPYMANLAQMFFERAIELAGGPAMRPKPSGASPAKTKPKRTPPSVPSSLIPQGVDEWQIYDMTGAGRAARSLTGIITTALTSLGKNVGQNQTAAAREKAVIAVVKRVGAALTRYADFGARDTEPRYVARSTMRQYLELILGTRKGFLFGSYPEVENALDWI